MTKTVRDNISDAAIKRHFLNPEVREIADNRHPLRIRFNSARNKASWFVVQYRSGRAIWKKVGTWPALNTRGMLAALPKILSDMAADPDADQIVQFDISSCADLLDWYCRRVQANRNLSKSRKANVKSGCKRLSDRLAGLSVSDLNHETLDDRLIQPLQAQYELSTVEQTWRILKHASKSARRLKLIESDPLAGIRFADFIDTRVKPRGSRLKPSDAREVYRQISGTSCPAAGLATLMILHGTRIGETRKARIEHLDIEAGFWTIPASDTKTKQEHRIPLTEYAIQQLERYTSQLSGNTGYLFPASGGRKPISASTANDWIKLVSGGDWTSHDLRKLARSLWMDLGTDYMVCEFLLNHAMNKLDKAYIHTHAEVQMRNALEKYHLHLEKLK